MLKPFLRYLFQLLGDVRNPLRALRQRLTGNFLVLEYIISILQDPDQNSDKDINACFLGTHFFHSNPFVFLVDQNADRQYFLPLSNPKL